ncbi:hypothetical protein BKA81DRAFT_376747 [Phyllosticta paracitricarpa]
MSRSEPGNQKVLRSSGDVTLTIGLAFGRAMQAHVNLQGTELPSHARPQRRPQRRESSPGRCRRSSMAAEAQRILLRAQCQRSLAEGGGSSVRSSFERGLTGRRLLQRRRPWWRYAKCAQGYPEIASHKRQRRERRFDAMASEERCWRSRRQVEVMPKKRLIAEKRCLRGLGPTETDVRLP